MPTSLGYGLGVTRILAGRELVFDGDGFLWDFSQWSEEVAAALAGESGLDELTEEHWKIILFLRSYYAQNGRSPLNKQVREGTGVSLMRIEALFPGGLKRGARRLAGLPNPRSCV